MGQKLTIDAAADELGISRRSLRRLITSGQLRAYRIGTGNHLVRIDRDDLSTLLNPVVPNGKM
ncbi:phiRv2 prophage protein [Mycobacterium europaeum]|uniref:PhiRv2 prophage protein n=1 Tax=Mycobacterium europaeum TaxID=761804 RepID=A0A0U1DBN8_9MYCO|nr:helix-turn-helix domain-containing protein [Mycobacterium europaeum]CQD10668.1 phiRv2 prophage protein [Mycobacterium europaeum]